MPRDWINVLKEPCTSVTVKFPVEKYGEKDQIETIKGVKIIHSNHHLPTFGGLKIMQNISHEDLEAHSIMNSFKASLHNIPFGGAVGCLYIDPLKYTYEEKVRIIRRFTVELWKRSMIGASTDVMGPDRGTDSRAMNIIHDTYKGVISNNSVEVEACVTGKSVSFGGLQDYEKAMAYSTAKCAEYVTKHLDNPKLKNTRLGVGGKKSIILHGLTRDSLKIIKCLPKDDFKVIGIVQGEEGCFNTLGFNVEEIHEYYLKNNKSLKGISKSLNDPREILSKTADIYLPTKELIVNKEIAQNLKCKIVFEASNFALSKEAIDEFKKRNLVVVPDILCNAGDIVMGYLEWLKNLEHRNLTLLFKRFDGNSRNTMIKMINRSDYGVLENPYAGPEETELIFSTLEEIVDNSFKKVLELCNENKDLSLRDASYMIALENIYNFYKTRGGVSI